LQGKYYLPTENHIRFELDLLMRVAASAPVCAPIVGRNGDVLQLLTHQNNLRFFALFDEAQGMNLDVDESWTANDDGEHLVEADDALPNAKQCKALGVAIAQFHVAADRYGSVYPRHVIDRELLLDKPRRVAASNGTRPERQRLARLERKHNLDVLIEKVEDIGHAARAWGPIHGDLNLSNVRFGDEIVMLFDFDHCAYGWRAYDLVLATDMSPNKRHAMIEGYDSIRPLSVAELEAIDALGVLNDVWEIGDLISFRGL
jgi:Ser/Thr protein kinase RdoA (MazF antagonist)